MNSIQEDGSEEGMDRVTDSRQTDISVYNGAEDCLESKFPRQRWPVKKLFFFNCLTEG